MRRLFRIIGLPALFAIVLGALPPSGVSYAQSNQPDFTIHLKSRRFVPAPGLEQALENQLRGEQADRLHALVQLFGPPSADLRSALEAQGVQLLGFIPNNAWLASIPNEVDALRSLLGDQVRWFGQIQTNDKISPFVRAGVFHSVAAQPGGYVDLVVTFFDDVEQGAAAAAVEAHGGSVTGSYPGGNKLVARVHQGQIRALAGEDAVQWIAQVPPDKQTLNDQVRGNSGVDELHRIGVDGSGVLAAMWDGGYPGAHDDFVDDVSGANRVARGDDTGGVNNHATHVAGTMAGDGSLRSDLKFMGMAPAAGILSYYWDDNLTDHLDAAVEGAALSQNSWGYTTNVKSFCYWGAYIWDAPQYDQIVRGYLDADGNGSIDPIAETLARLMSVQFAAGNDQGAKGPCHDGSGYDTIGPPGTAKNVITVGAINTNNSTMTSFSSWGPMDDGRVKPDVVAGGCQSDGDNGVTSTLPDDSYGSACGTSMATPAVSGLVAVLIDHYKGLNNGAEPPPSTLKAILIHTARDLGNAGPDYQFGYGAIDAPAVAGLIDSKNIVEGELSQGDTLTVQFSGLTGATELRATLVWSDKEAEENAAKTLVNDLDLVVTGPDGSHAPWVLNPDDPPAPASTGVDSTNPVEQVLVTNPEDGDWTIEVKGTAVPTAEAQGFSLVWSVVSSEPVTDITDIAVTAVSAPGSVVQGDVASVDVTVENVGNQDVTSDFNVTLTDDTDSVTIGTQTITGGLAAGASVTLTYSWDTGSATVGNHTLSASHDFADDDASNDSKSTVVSVESAVTDIAVTAVTAPSSVVQGDVVNVDVTVENVGNQDVTSDINVTLTDDTDAVTIGTQTVTGGLAAGASTTLTYSWDTSGATPGDHTLTASHDFADDDANNDSESTVVNVSEAGSTMHVGDLDGEGIKLQQGNWYALVTITIHDASHSGVESATVSGTWSQNGTTIGTGTCATDSTGSCTVDSRDAGPLSKQGKATFAVDKVTHATLTYDAAANHDPDGDSDGTSITVSK